MHLRQIVTGRSSKAHSEPERATKILTQSFTADDGNYSRLLIEVNHDLRGPLTVILGFIEVLKSETTGELNDTQRGLMDHIRCAALSIQAVAEHIQQHAKCAF